MIKTSPRRHAYVWRVPSAGAFQSHAVYHDDGKKKKKKFHVCPWPSGSQITILPCDTREFLSMPSDSPWKKRKMREKWRVGIFFWEGGGSWENRYRKFAGERHLGVGATGESLRSIMKASMWETSVFEFSPIFLLPNSIPMFPRIKKRYLNLCVACKTCCDVGTSIVKTRNFLLNNQRQI